ncbi:ABC transporter permease/M1 family aminopeptidase [Pyxidicoccus sp. MSG2]|uniref:ABC transporter permease/M1 family aminopeptidase n=1 Tax=Pyxidicoccus sp. MSG2 TaxID=2996790 RepID=UPI00226E4C91|nr:M1 family aminopeptidase [Pyxidicoccus sp. MSG2]MCY1017700.1 M1 family aminopeptidase [Pyxidicoccus sp. MSG2]
MNTQRLGTVVRTELAHQVRRPLFVILLLITFLTVWGLSSGNVTIESGASQVGGQKAWVTSEFAVSQTLIFLTFLLYTFFISVGAGMGVIADEEARVGPILHTTPLTPREYVWGKFLAVLAAYGLALGAMVAFLVFFHHVVPAGENAEYRGPLSLLNYVRPALFFGVPLLVFMAGTAFAVGELTRRPVLVYFLPVVLMFICAFFLWDWAPGWLDPRVNRLLMAVEPAGLRWLSETWVKVDRGVEFYNHERVGLDALFVLSRLGFIAVGLGGVAWSARHVAQGLRGAPVRPVKGKTLADVPPATPLGTFREHAPLASLNMGVRAPGLLSGLWDVARVEARGLLSQPGLYLFVPIILLQTVVQSLNAVGPFDTPLLATPGHFAVRSMGQASTLVCLLLMFYTVESLERERAFFFAPIHDATPVRTLSVLLGKAFANSLVGVAILMVMWLAVSLVQLAQGKVSVALVPYAIVWGLLMLPTFVLWTCFVLAARAVAGGRFGAYGLALAVLCLTGFAAVRGELNWATNWPLWGTVLWSDLGPFELDRTVLVLNRVGALGLAAFFAALAVRLDGRRAPDSVSLLERLKPRGLLSGAWRLTPWMVVPAVALIGAAVQVGQGWQGDAAKKRAKEYWQKNLATWKDAPQPAIQDVDLDVDLEPEAGTFHTRGTYTLVNRHDKALESFALTGGDHWEDVRWTVDGKEFEAEDRSRLYVFKPAGGMAPGAVLRVGFDFHGRFPKGATKSGGKVEEFILPSGVVLTSFGPSFAPVIGFKDDIGVDPKENKYEPRVYSDRFYEGQTEAAWGTGTPFTTRIRVTGPEDYTLNSAGVLESDEVKDGRRASVWKSDHPMSMFNIVAGKWTVLRGEGTAVFHHPSHVYNVKEMQRGLDAARKYYSEWFYPYPWKELKLSEFPGLATYAQGFATNITFSESIGFLTKSTSKANAVLLITAHEAAHQWWGNMLIPGKGPGGDVLSEGTSHYSALKLAEQLEGPAMRMEIAKRLEERYGKDRRLDAEQSLVKLDNTREGDNTVLYDKGGWVFWMMEDLLGREAMHAGIQAFLRQYIPSADHPVLQDFTAAMRPFAKDAAAYDAFVQQWFHEVHVPEYRLSAASVKQEGAQWVATVTVENTGTGRMPVEVAAVKGERFPERTEEEAAKGPATQSPDYRDARTTVVLGAGEKAEVTVRADFAPERWVVDPDVRVLQLRRESAVLKL